jgi:hypothetical protein
MRCTLEALARRDELRKSEIIRFFIDMLLNIDKGKVLS